MAGTCPICGKPIEVSDTICPHCKYKLLGSTQRFQPVTLADEVIPSPEKALARAALHVVRGPQAGVAFSLGDKELTVGRSPQCDIFLNDMTVSRQHASINRTDEGYVINDNHSFNGVWVNNKNVESVVLQQGDVIQIGVFCLLYQEE